jgi:NAD(P)-dependent dehydrogenase (short-subunit alcohol dehydrogenase family)
MDRLAGKVALITGGASGLGRQAAIRMTEEGAKVVITDINAELGAQTAEEIGGDILFLEHNVTHEAGWQAVIEVALTRHGRLDVVVNGAGIVSVGNVEDLAYDDWKHVQAVNSDSVFLGCKYGVAAIKQTSRDAETGGGSIINISSVSGLIGGHNLAAYNASKGAVRLLTKSVALHCARHGYNIRCNSVHPTFIETPMVKAMYENTPDPEQTRAKLAKQIPLRHMGEPDDIAWGIVYLASDESKFMTGTEFVVDGGITAM